MTGRGEDGRRYQAEAWDPLHAVACELWRGFWEPLRRRVTDALSVVGSLGPRPLPPGNDWAVDAFILVLADPLTSELGLPEPRRQRLVQLVVAQLYHGREEAGRLDPRFFWNLLNDLADQLRHTAEVRGPRVRLSAVIDAFLARYALDGPENLDVIEGLHRIASPAVREGRAVLAARARRLASSAGDEP